MSYHRGQKTPPEVSSDEASAKDVDVDDAGDGVVVGDDGDDVVVL